ncbi:MAG TPA: hypothetical protein VD833_24765 [Vicinamibacterales bacterium]|nr:hypothetical protein [Vicinamibacterales bacterium]
MKRARTGVIAAAILAVASIAWAQKPDFSGTWTPDPPPDAAAGGGGRGMMSGPLTVKHSGDTLSVERQGRGGAVTTVYKLDGSETKVAMGQMEATATAKWDGNKIVISTTTPNGTGTQTWSLEGGVLTIERTGGRGAGKMTYKKST